MSTAENPNPNARRPRAANSRERSMARCQPVSCGAGASPCTPRIANIAARIASSGDRDAPLADEVDCAGRQHRPAGRIRFAGFGAGGQGFHGERDVTLAMGLCRVRQCGLPCTMRRSARRSAPIRFRSQPAGRRPARRPPRAASEVSRSKVSVPGNEAVGRDVVGVVRGAAPAHEAGRDETQPSEPTATPDRQGRLQHHLQPTVWSDGVDPAGEPRRAR